MVMALAKRQIQTLSQNILLRIDWYFEEFEFNLRFLFHITPEFEFVYPRCLGFVDL